MKRPSDPKIPNRRMVMNMKMRGLSFFLAVMFMFFTAGCASMQGHEGAAVGAGAGAATGAVAGALIGKGAGAVVVGSLLGALAGGAVGALCL